MVCLVLNPICLTKGLVNPLVWNSCGHALCPGTSRRFSAPLLRGRLAHTLGLIWVQRGTSLSQSGYANFRDVPAFLSKIAHSSHLMSCLLLCFPPNLSAQRSGQSQTWRKFPLLRCVLRLVPAAYLSGRCSNWSAPQRASFTVQRRGDDWFYSVSSLAGPRAGLLFKFHAHSGCVPSLLALGMRVSGGNVVFLSISLLWWFNTNSFIRLTQTYRDWIKMKVKWLIRAWVSVGLTSTCCQNL